MDLDLDILLNLDSWTGQQHLERQCSLDKESHESQMTNGSEGRSHSSDHAHADDQEPIPSFGVMHGLGSKSCEEEEGEFKTVEANNGPDGVTEEPDQEEDIFWLVKDAIQVGALKDGGSWEAMVGSSGDTGGGGRQGWRKTA